MANDDFYQLLDLENLNKYVSENSNKSLRIVLFLSGFVIGAIVPTLGIDLESIKRGLLFGLIIGFIWIALRYRQSGKEGLVETQNEIFVAFVYLICLINS